MVHRGAADRWREAVAQLRTFKRRGQRAVHKPLLTLLLLARAERGEAAQASFEEICGPLGVLLREFGPLRTSYHPEYPFWHLQTDGIWVVRESGTFALRKSGNSPSKRTLLQGHAEGEVPDVLWRALVADAALRAELAATILDDYWPATYHEPIRRVIGLPEPRVSSRAARDPAFRERVLRAYERRCAVCGYDGRLGRDDLALEAAHIRWHCYDGPDDVSNGLALCSFHHAALDRGAWGPTPDMRIQVSADVHGTVMVDTLLLRHVDVPMRPPQPGQPRPDAAFVAWHEQQVFRKPARSAS